MSTLKEICKEQRELLNECRQNIKKLTEENEKLKEDLKITKKTHLGYIKYFSNNNELLRDEVKSLKQENTQLKEENTALRLQSDTYFDEWQNEKLTSQGLREQCKEYAQDASKYTTLTNHIRLKAENNPGVSRYIDLVNYIDRLERD